MRVFLTENVGIVSFYAEDWDWTLDLFYITPLLNSTTPDTKSFLYPLHRNPC